MNLSILALILVGIITIYAVAFTMIIKLLGRIVILRKQNNPLWPNSVESMISWTLFSLSTMRGNDHGKALFISRPYS